MKNIPQRGMRWNQFLKLIRIQDNCTIKNTYILKNSSFYLCVRIFDRVRGNRCPRRVVIRMSKPFDYNYPQKPPKDSNQSEVVYGTPVGSNRPPTQPAYGYGGTSGQQQYPPPPAGYPQQQYANGYGAPPAGYYPPPTNQPVYYQQQQGYQQQQMSPGPDICAACLAALCCCCLLDMMF